MSIRDLRAQVKAIAATEDITINWSPVRHGAAGTADPETREVVTRYVLSLESYCCAMHELGHILSGITSPREGARGFSCAKRLEEEAHAWDWALQHMPPKVARSRAVEIYVILALARYLYWAQCFTRRLPDQDGMFWRLMRLDWPGIYWDTP